MKKIILSLGLVLAVLITKAQNTAIDKITTSYISVKNALVANNADLAKRRSAELSTALAMPVKGFTPTQKTAWAAYAGKLRVDSKLISQAGGIEGQRTRFESLSKNMYSLLAGLKLNSTTLYQQYCPMKKAAWLSETEDIRNPYYGEDMLECGKVTATLKASN